MIFQWVPRRFNVIRFGVVAFVVFWRPPRSRWKRTRGVISAAIDRQGSGTVGGTSLQGVDNIPINFLWFTHPMHRSKLPRSISRRSMVASIGTVVSMVIGFLFDFCEIIPRFLRQPGSVRFCNGIYRKTISPRKPTFSVAMNRKPSSECMVGHGSCVW